MSKNNPFVKEQNYRYSLAYQITPAGTKRLLDIGCGEGKFLGGLRQKADQLYGVDVDANKIQLAGENYPFVNFSCVSDVKKLAFKDQFFEVVTLLDVLEHLDDEKATIKEIGRLLKPNGLLILSVPNQGLFSFIDPGNLKFIAPNFHRWLYCSFFGRQQEYLEKFGKRKEELFGDFVSRQSYHRHYALKDLEDLLKPRFEIKKVHYYGISPLPAMVWTATRWLFHKNFRLLEKASWLDKRLNLGRFSFSILVSATKN